MSTRANIIVQDSFNKLYFYRHSDGYPEGAMPTIERFMNAAKDGKIRRNPSQASGWLIIYGADEPEYKLDKVSDLQWFRPENESKANDIATEWKNTIPVKPLTNESNNWKVGAIEPTDNIHGDIEYLYECDMDTMEVRIYKTPVGFEHRNLEPELIETRNFKSEEQKQL